jgi:septum formation protein
MALARKKAVQVGRTHKGTWILGADTLVVIDGRILGKPLNGRDIKRMLEALSGREHRVFTGFCLIDPGGKTAHEEAVLTRVRIKNLSREEIEAYLETGEPFGKAGGYAIQGVGAFMVEGIYGSYTNVVGLPLCALIKALLRVGALSRFPIPCLLTKKG